MGHRDRRPLAHSPALVRESERRGRTAYGIHIRTVVVGVDLLRRGSALGHRLVVKRPELMPGHLDLTHKERRDPDLFLRALIRRAERLVVRAADRELTSRNSDHPDRGCRTGNRFREVREGCHHGSTVVSLTTPRVHHLAFQSFMLVARHVVAGVQMAADALEIQFSGVFLIVEMSSDAVIRDSGREKIDVTFLAGFVVNDF